MNGRIGKPAAVVVSELLGLQGPWLSVTVVRQLWELIHVRGFTKSMPVKQLEEQSGEIVNQAGQL